MFAQMQKAVGMGLTVNSTWTGEHGSSPAGWAHYNGHAFDSIGSQDVMWKYFHQTVSTAKPHEMIFHQQHILGGKQVGY